MRKIEKEEISELLYSKYPDVISMLKGKGLNESDMEDIAAETFMAAFRNIDTLRDRSRMTSWLKTIARNKTCKYFSMMEKSRQLYSVISEEKAREHHILHTSGHNSVEDMIQKTERSRMLKKYIGTLPETGRRIIVMRFWGGYKHSEIAEALHMNVNTEKSIYRRSLRKLRMCIAAGEKGTAS